MKAEEVHKLTGEEIDTEVDRMKKKLFDLRCEAQTEKIEDPTMFKKLKRDVARLLTERRARLLKQKVKA